LEKRDLVHKNLENPAQEHPASPTEETSYIEPPASNSQRTFLRSSTKNNVATEVPGIDQELKNRAKQLIEPKSMPPLPLATNNDEPRFASVAPANSIKFVPPTQEADELELSPLSMNRQVIEQQPVATSSEKAPVVNNPYRSSFSSDKKFAPTVKEYSITEKNVTRNDSHNPPRVGVPFVVFMLLLFYASIVTLLCVHLYLESWVGNPQELESLPDIVPVIKDGQTVYHLVPEGRKLPAGHLLSLHESRRFGNIEVTAVKVTYGPVEFEHRQADSHKQNVAGKPAYKLWLEVKNVSTDQTFAPLDRQLLLMKVADKNHPDRLRSNHFLSAVTDRLNLDEHLLVYNLPKTSNLKFKDHQDDDILKPGVTQTIYIPVEPVASMTTPTEMIWRVQLRKGYHPQTHHGVTTLVEIKFNTRDVVIEQPVG
jgi:hypothetical protein